MVDRYSYNGNDPERHREFLRALRHVPGTLRIIGSSQSPIRSRRIDLEVFLSHLDTDATTIIDFDDPEVIRIDTSYASDPRRSDTSWRLQYDIPWIGPVRERVDALRREHYGK